MIALLWMCFLPPNGSRASKPRFDLPSAVMNALTFGLLITASVVSLRGNR